MSETPAPTTTVCAATADVTRFDARQVATLGTVVVLVVIAVLSPTLHPPQTTD
jgi:hypothetical protein